MAEGWLGCKCPVCKGTGYATRKDGEECTCGACAGTGEEYGDLINLPEHKPCGHPGCLNHVTHPCEGCGRIAGKKPDL